MEYLLNYFLTFLNYVEEGRKHAYEATGKWADKREVAVEYLSKIEAQFKNYHPFTLLIGFFVLFIALRFFLNKLKKIWRAISREI
jgi:membrane protein DedA with SNARE-associated domain